jgi:hypothetical protein
VSRVLNSFEQTPSSFSSAEIVGSILDKHSPYEAKDDAIITFNDDEKPISKELFRPAMTSFFLYE